MCKLRVYASGFMCHTSLRLCRCAARPDFDMIGQLWLRATSCGAKSAALVLRSHRLANTSNPLPSESRCLKTKFAMNFSPRFVISDLPTAYCVLLGWPFRPVCIIDFISTAFLKFPF